MPQHGLTTEEMISVMYDRSERFEHAIFGNGQPGLLDRVARVEEQNQKRNRVATKAGGTGAVLAAVLTTLLGWLHSAVR